MENNNTPQKVTSHQVYERDLAGHILEILNNPRTPVALYDAVRGFITDSIDIKDSTGESLLDRWACAPETIAAACSWASEQDDNREIAAELTARVARG